MKAFILKQGLRTEIKYLVYDSAHGVQGTFIDHNHTTTNDELYDILIVDGMSSRLIESCHNVGPCDWKYAFRAVRIKDL